MYQRVSDNPQKSLEFFNPIAGLYLKGFCSVYALNFQA